MQAYLDSVPFIVARPTVQAALEEAVRRAQGAGRIIIEVKCDGRVLSEAELEFPSDHPGRYAEVHCLSANPRAMVREVLLDAREALEGVAGAQADAARAIQTGNLVEARTLLEGVVSTWQAVVAALSRGSALVGLDLDALRAADGEPSAGVLARSLAARLRSLTGALVREDWSALADEIELDLGEQATRWRALLARVVDDLGKGSA
jgi:hypothetical protein